MLPQQCLGLSNIQLAQSTPLLKVICQTTAHIKLSRPWRDVYLQEENLIPGQEGRVLSVCHGARNEKLTVQKPRFVHTALLDCAGHIMKVLYNDPEIKQVRCGHGVL